MESDTMILFGIMMFFILMGVFIPYIDEAFGQPSVLNVIPTAPSGGGVLNTLASAFEIIISITSMFFWTFGAIPALLDIAFMLPIRLIFFYLIARYIRGI